MTCTQWCSNSFTSSPQRLFCDHKAPTHISLHHQSASREVLLSSSLQVHRKNRDYWKTSKVKHTWNMSYINPVPDIKGLDGNYVAVHSPFFLMLLYTTCTRCNIFLYWKQFFVCITHSWYNLWHPSCIFSPLHRYWECLWTEVKISLRHSVLGSEWEYWTVLALKGSCLSYADWKWYPVNSKQFAHFC